MVFQKFNNNYSKSTSLNNNCQIMIYIQYVYILKCQQLLFWKLLASLKIYVFQWNHSKSIQNKMFEIKNIVLIIMSVSYYCFYFISFSNDSQTFKYFVYTTHIIFKTNKQLMSYNYSKFRWKEWEWHRGNPQNEGPLLCLYEL